MPTPRTVTLTLCLALLVPLTACAGRTLPDLGPRLTPRIDAVSSALRSLADAAAAMDGRLDRAAGSLADLAAPDAPVRLAVRDLADAVQDARTALRAEDRTPGAVIDALMRVVRAVEDLRGWAARSGDVRDTLAPYVRTLVDLRRLVDLE